MNIKRKQFSKGTKDILWNELPLCDCEAEDCTPNNHRICSAKKCSKTILKGAHFSVQPNSYHAWDIDHIKALKNGGTNHISNLRIICVECNRKKN